MYLNVKETPFKLYELPTPNENVPRNTKTEKYQKIAKNVERSYTQKEKLLKQYYIRLYH